MDVAYDIPKLKKMYPKIEIASLIAVLERFKDLGGWQGQRMSRKTIKKKDVDAVIRYLRENQINVSYVVFCIDLILCISVMKNLEDGA